MKMCMCGAIKGKVHAPFCPYPYYGNKVKKESAWMDAYRTMKQKSPLKLRMSGKGQARKFAKEIIKQIYEPGYVYPAPKFPRFNCAGKVIVDELESGLTKRAVDGAYWLCIKCGQRNDDAEHFECVACGSPRN